MFGKTNKNTQVEEKPEVKKVTTDNILEVFSKDMMQEKKKEISESLSKKDPILYLNKVTGSLKFGFFIVLFFSIILSGYGYVQKNQEMNNLSLLEPMCFILLGGASADLHDGCGSITNVMNYYEDKLMKLKTEQAEKNLSILEELYALDNFLFTEDISFLLEKSSSKLPVIDILSEFNEIKDSFEPTKKVYSVECNDIIINNELELKISCSSYSSDWSDSNIMGFNGQTTSKKISGTSITVASSFINFIKRKGENFQVIEATKLYNYGGQAEEGKERYTKKTDFELTLKYINQLAR